MAKRFVPLTLYQSVLPGTKGALPDVHRSRGQPSAAHPNVTHQSFVPKVTTVSTETCATGTSAILGEIQATLLQFHQDCEAWDEAFDELITELDTALNNEVDMRHACPAAGRVFSEIAELRQLAEIQIGLLSGSLNPSTPAPNKAAGETLTSVLERLQVALG